MYKFFVTLVCLAVLPSCSFVDDGSVSQPAVIQQARTAYVVKPEDSSRDIEKYLETALSTREPGAGIQLNALAGLLSRCRSLIANLA